MVFLSNASPKGHEKREAAEAKKAMKAAKVMKQAMKTKRRDTFLAQAIEDQKVAAKAKCMKAMKDMKAMKAMKA